VPSGHSGGHRLEAAAPHGEAAALYCFNPWLGACHVDALGVAGKYGSRPHVINPLLAASLMQIQAAVGGRSGGVLRPSTGLVGVGLALASCARVSLFGFGNDTDPRMQGHCNHYYDCRTNQTNYFAGRMGYHDWHGQWRVLSSLIELGAINYVPPTGEPNRFLARQSASVNKQTGRSGRHRVSMKHTGGRQSKLLEAGGRNRSDADGGSGLGAGTAGASKLSNKIKPSGKLARLAVDGGGGGGSKMNVTTARHHAHRHRTNALNKAQKQQQQQQHRSAAQGGGNHDAELAGSGTAPPRAADVFEQSVGAAVARVRAAG
jgi:hypothetical protein